MSVHFINAIPFKDQAQFNTNATSTITFTQRTAPFTNAINVTTFATKNFFYAVGGNTNGTWVQRAPINADGSLGTFIRDTDFPVTASGCKAIITKDHVFLLAGKFGGAVSTTIYQASINADGTIGTWTAAANLMPAARARNQVFFNDPYIYSVGGYDGTDTAQSGIYRATIAQDGTIGAWSTLTAFPEIYGDAQVVDTGARVYFIGGSSNGSGNKTNWYYAVKNADGTMGTWTTFAAPAGRSNMIVFSTENFVWAFGGDDSGFGVSNIIWRAPITSGVVGSWTNIGTAPNPMFIGWAVTATNSKIYVAGSTDLGTTVSYWDAPFTGGSNDYLATGFSWFQDAIETGVIAQTLKLVTQAATGAEWAKGSAAQTLLLIKQSATGQQWTKGSIVQTLKLVNQSGTGWAEVIGSAAQTLFRITQLASPATQIFTGTAAQRLNLINQAASGWHSIFGAAAQRLFRVTQSAEGAVAQFVGAIRMTLKLIQQNVVGQQWTQGPIVQVLPLVRQTVRGWAEIIGDAAMTLPLIRQIVNANEVTLDTLFFATTSQLNDYVARIQKQIRSTWHGPPDDPLPPVV